MIEGDGDQLTYLVVAVEDVKSALDWLSRLRPSDYDSALTTARHHAHEMIYAIEEWAKANGIELPEEVES